jgi:hypothetical protein
MPGFDSCLRHWFFSSASFDTGCGASLPLVAPLSMWIKWSSMTLTTHLHPVLRSRMHEALFLCMLYAIKAWCWAQCRFTLCCLSHRLFWGWHKKFYFYCKSRVQYLEQELLTFRSKEREETAALEKAVEQVADNLKRTTVSTIRS